MADTPTPGKPGTYLPIPGQAQNLDPSNNDTTNAVRIKSQNSSPQQGAATINGARLNADANDGKIYTGPTTPIVDATAQKVQEFTDTATQAKGPKGEKGDKGDQGPRGPQGPIGPAGADGPAATVDYDKIRDMIQQMLDSMLNLKAFQFVKPTPTSVFGGKTINLPVELVDQLANTSSVVTAKSYTLAIPGAGTITAAGLFTAADVQVDTVTSLTANYTDSSGKNYTAQTNITVKALKVSSLAISGPSSLNSAGTGTYAATATYTDGTTKVVTADANTTWSIASGSIGTLANNVLTAPVVGANATGQIKAVYVEKGTTVQAVQNVTITAPQLKPFYGAAAHPVSATNADPTKYTGWSAFVQTLNLASNSSKVNTFTINQTTSQYGWYAYPKSFGLMDMSKIKGNAQPGTGGWDSAGAPNTRTGSFWGTSGPIEITVTVNGSDVPFYLYRTDNVGVNDTWVVSA